MQLKLSLPQEANVNDRMPRRQDAASTARMYDGQEGPPLRR